MQQYTAADAAAKYETYRRAGHPLTPEQVVDELMIKGLLLDRMVQSIIPTVIMETVRA